MTLNQNKNQLEDLSIKHIDISNINKNFTEKLNNSKFDLNLLTIKWNELLKEVGLEILDSKGKVDQNEKIMKLEKENEELRKKIEELEKEKKN